MLFLARKDKIINNETKFTSYKENGIVIVLWPFLSILMTETTGMHFYYFYRVSQLPG